MPVKIQELVVQTKIKTENAELNHATNGSVNYVNKHELRRLEERVYVKCIEAVEALIKELKER